MQGVASYSSGLQMTGRVGPSHGLATELLPVMLDHTIRTFFPSIWEARGGDALTVHGVPSSLRPLRLRHFYHMGLHVDIAELCAFPSQFKGCNSSPWCAPGLARSFDLTHEAWRLLSVLVAPPCPCAAGQIQSESMCVCAHHRERNTRLHLVL